MFRGSVEPKFPVCNHQRLMLDDQPAGTNVYRLSIACSHISVLGRDGFQKRSCESYAVVKKAYDRLLPKELTA